MVATCFTSHRYQRCTAGRRAGSCAGPASARRCQPMRALGTCGRQLLAAVNRRLEIRRLRLVSAYLTPTSSRITTSDLLLQVLHLRDKIVERGFPIAHWAMSGHDDSDM